ncbi:MAG TPA: type II secretion system F family protein [Candidatus Babeliales bacterium]|nr:type II secretion system F family protein [Candidatus Babeliales bacterium]
MPYFNWQGVTLTGKVKQGKLFARTREELDTILLRRDIALLKTTPVSSIWLFRGGIALAIKIGFFRQLASLLQAGVLLPDALLILTEQIDHPKFQEVLYAISNEVHQGEPAHVAMAKHGAVFDGLMIYLVDVGNQAGALPQALIMLSDYLETKQGFKKKIRAAALMPAITLGFFCAIALFIFLVIIPQFKQIFMSMHKEVPYVTQLLINMSDGLMSWVGLFVIGGIIALGFFGKMYVKTATGSKVVDALLLRITIVGDLVRQSALMTMTQSIALLLEAGMPLLSALRAARTTVANSVLQEQMRYLEQAVSSGSSLSVAMAQHPEQLFEQAAISMIKVGEESGQLNGLLRKVAMKYQEEVSRQLTLFTALFQPFLIVVLGVLITALIFAVYLPIFNLANVV